jgi:DNA polymerase IV
MLELPLGDARPVVAFRQEGQGIVRWSADRAMDAVRERFGRDAVGYATGCRASLCLART